MPRKYKKQGEKRHYAAYSVSTLERCLNAVRSGELTQRKAEKKFKIPRRTIFNKLRNHHANKPGQNPVFCPKEEGYFAKCFETIFGWGFPLSSFEMRVIIYSYLEETGRRVDKFIDNVPGVEWACGFIERHSFLSPHLNSCSYRSKMEPNEETFVRFINDLTVTTANITPENIWVIDQMNVTDSPGRKRVIVKRNATVAEKINYSLRTNVSLIVAANAAGDRFPPCPVYRPACLWPSLDNEEDIRWLRTHTFETWFINTFLPVLRETEETKIIICDNLSTHLTLSILDHCEDCNITFVCMPSNSSYVMQPLELRPFHPMKSAWLQVLCMFEEDSDGFKNLQYQKENYGSILELLATEPEVDVSNEIIAAFQSCGLHPPRLERLLLRLMESQSDKNKSPTLQETLGSGIDRWTVKKSTAKDRLASPSNKPEEADKDDNLSLQEMLSGVEPWTKKSEDKAETDSDREDEIEIFIVTNDDFSDT